MRHLRRCIRIAGDRSPNVRAGIELRRRFPDMPDAEVERRSHVMPGVLSWADWQKRCASRDEAWKTVTVGADWYEGKEVKWFPPAWLDKAHELHRKIGRRGRRARAIGCDPGESGAETAWAVVDEAGMICPIIAELTPDTSVIRKRSLALLREHGLPPEMMCLDRGGGGLQIADDLRDAGFPVRTVAFGEAVAPAPRRPGVIETYKERVGKTEERSAFVNRRAEMYWALRILLDPDANPAGFAIPAADAELRRQLASIPMQMQLPGGAVWSCYDREGRIRMLPKSRQGASVNEVTLTDILGCSPDRADALVTAVFAMRHEPMRRMAGVAT